MRIDPKDRPRLKYQSFIKLKARQNANYQHFKNSQLISEKQDYTNGDLWTLNLLNLIASSLLCYNCFSYQDNTTKAIGVIFLSIIIISFLCCLITNFFLPLTDHNPFRTFFQLNNVLAVIYACWESWTLDLSQTTLIIADAIIGLYLIQLLEHRKDFKQNDKLN